MIAPVQPNPTSTASTGGFLISAMSYPRFGTIPGHANRTQRILFTVAAYPVRKVGAGTRKTDHLPGTHVPVAAVNRIGEITFLGVLQQPHKECLSCDRFECDLTVF